MLYTEKKRKNTIWFANIGDTKELKTKTAWSKKTTVFKCLDFDLVCKVFWPIRKNVPPGSLSQ